jgi:SAM-dependent methyltransferase
MPNTILRSGLKSIAFALFPILPRFVTTRYKNSREIAFWSDRYREGSGRLGNWHYEHFYTSYFGIPKDEYFGKKVLDIGCGPRGSLEWLDHAEERVGLDPLVNKYRRLGIDAHRMRYVQAPSENIPFENGHFDFVTSFNSLDHVDNIDKTLREITRVLKANGEFLLITEINHPPTPTEPHTISEDLIDRLSRDFQVLETKLVAIRSDHDVYQSLRDAIPYGGAATGSPGILCARLRRKPV